MGGREKRRRREPPPRIEGLIDSHCHLDYPPMSDDVEATLARAAEAGVEQIVQIGCDLERMEPAIALAQAHDNVFATVGIHPHEARVIDDGVMERVRTLAADDSVVAIGETGLDYHYDRSPRPQQIEGLRRHVALARELDLPLVLHIRDAHEDAWKVLQDEAPRANPGIVHCFTGGPEEAKEWLSRGWHLSFSGIATFRTATPIQEAARDCPADRILLETDAPFLAPEPMRGRKNEPAYVAFTCEFLAGVRGEEPRELAQRATRNTRALLRLPEPT